MGHPFDWTARKRRGSGGQTTSNPTEPTASHPYEQYFNNDMDFPGFDTFGRSSGRKRSQQPLSDAHSDRNSFYEHLPPEFRQYFPDSFGFVNSMRHQPPPSHPPPPSQTMNRSPPVSPPQREAVYVQQEVTRPKLCDAAIQTENFDGNQVSTNLQQHGLRNTVDLGQKSAQEEVRQDRAQSAPPSELNATQQSATGTFANVGPNTTSAGTFATTGTTMTPQQQQHVPPNFQSQSNHPQFQNQTQTSTDGGVRTIPIFVEGRNVPIVVKDVPVKSSPPQQQQKQQQPRPEPLNTNEPNPADNNNQSDQSDDIPPQTPHTFDCINKIQSIQKDVLDLMGKVDKFNGIRGDREYMFIDEMLTRNLLKLDTIDTNGKDSIRLARKEAIRCIQASITVLEAKAENNVKAKEQMDNEQAVEPAKESNDKNTVVASTTSHVSAVKINLNKPDDLVDSEPEIKNADNKLKEVETTPKG